MGSPTVPGSGPWKIRMDPSADEPGVYAITLMDPTAGGAQSGPFYLAFPTAGHAAQWLTSLARVESESAQRALERGAAVSGTADPLTWAPMISVMFHSANIKHGLGAPWWYGSTPYWAEVDPLLPPMTQAAEQILAEERPAPEMDITPLLDTCVLTLDDEKPGEVVALSRAGMIEYPDEDYTANYMVVVWPVGQEAKYFTVDGPLVGVGTRLGPFTFMSEKSGRVTIRPVQSSDGPALSGLGISLPEEALGNLLITQDQAERDGHSWREALVAVVDPEVRELDKSSVFGLYYRLHMSDNVPDVWWCNEDGWTRDELPNMSPQWLAVARELGYSHEELVSQNTYYDVSLAISEFGDHLEVEPHAAELLLDRYRRQLPIDRLMLAIAALPADERISPESLREPFGSALRIAIDSDSHIFAEANPPSRTLARVGPNHTVPASELLRLYAYLVDSQADSAE